MCVNITDVQTHLHVCYVGSVVKRVSKIFSFLDLYLKLSCLTETRVLQSYKREICCDYFLMFSEHLF